MADSTAPTTEQAPSAPVADKPETEQNTAAEAPAESTKEPKAAMSGALQSPDAAVTKAPEASEGTSIQIAINSRRRAS